MRRLISIIATTLVLAVAAIGAARAAEVRSFDPALLASAQDAGRPILVDVWASWCPTCARQKPIIERLAKDPAFKNLLILTLDYDKHYDLAVGLKAYMQSTLIAFSGRTEVGRSTGDTREASIRKLVLQAVSGS